MPPSRAAAPRAGPIVHLRRAPSSPVASGNAARLPS